MGTAASQYSEWIELYNDGADAVSLDGWKLYKTGNTLLYTLSKSINAGKYLLVERITASAPDAVPGISDEAGAFGGAGLRNTGEDLSLQDKDGNTINIVPFASSWPAGDAKSKDTMQWTGSKWITAPGTPDAQNASDNAPPETPAVVTVTDVPYVPPVTIETNPSTDSSASPQIVAVQTPIVAVPATVTVPPASIASVVMMPVAPHTESPAVTQISPIISAQPQPVIASVHMAKNPAIKKSIPIASVAASSDNTAADALQDPSDQTAPPQKENNHIKIIIFGAVILIGMALFLLLERLKAQQE